MYKHWIEKNRIHYCIVFALFSAFLYVLILDQKHKLNLCEKNLILASKNNHKSIKSEKSLVILPVKSESAAKHENTIVKDQYIIHRFWSYQKELHDLNRKILTSFWSGLNTQSNSKTIIWTLPSSLSYLTELTKDMRNCGSSSLEIKSIAEILHLLEALEDDSPLKMCIPSFQKWEENMVAFSDLVRFIALYFFGGIYVDVDVIFLMDMKAFHGKSFAYKWDLNVNSYNTAIMGLPMDSKLVIQIIKYFGGCNSAVFYPSTIHEAMTCEGGICKELVMMPTALFNPTSSSSSNYQWFETPDKKNLIVDFVFNQERFWDLEHFYPGSYTFHWHNRWDWPIHPKSFFASFEYLHSRCTFDEPTHCRKLFLDLGGYTGDTLKLWGNFQDEIYVFEIDPVKVSTIYEFLNTSLHYLKEKTTVIHGAAWNEDSRVNVILTGHNDGRVESNGVDQVLAYNIGKWIVERIAPTPCDTFLVKIDIEGAEVEVLSNLDKYGILKLVDHLIIEWHDWIMPKVQSSKKDLENLLMENGLTYKYATLDDKLDVKYLPGDAWPVNHCDSHYFSN